MRYRFQFRRYRLPFRAAVRTAHGVWAEREGVVVRLTAGEGRDEKLRAESRELRAGFGEAAPVPGFSTETVDEIEAACREIGEWVEEERLCERAGRLACLKNAVMAAAGEVGRVFDPLFERESSGGARVQRNGDRESAKGRVENPPYLGVAALLPAGRAAIAQIGPKAEMGFRVFKWKVGVGDVADELALLDDVCAALPSGAKLRLDANGAWDRRKAEKWLARCAERPVEFVEQPAFAEPTAGRPARAKVDDMLLGLAGDFPTKIALDESLVGDGDVERWIGAGWPGVFVVKPALLGDVAGTVEKLATAKADVVWSSALETAVGARAALAHAFAWARNAECRLPNTELKTGGDGAPPSTQAAQTVRALGFGVWPLFQDRRFDGPSAAPFLRWEDVERMEVSAAWEALGS